MTWNIGAVFAMEGAKVSIWTCWWLGETAWFVCLCQHICGMPANGLLQQHPVTVTEPILLELLAEVPHIYDFHLFGFIPSTNCTRLYWWKPCIHTVSLWSMLWWSCLYFLSVSSWGWKVLVTVSHLKSSQSFLLFKCAGLSCPWWQVPNFQCMGNPQRDTS